MICYFFHPVLFDPCQIKLKGKMYDMLVIKSKLYYSSKITNENIVLTRFIFRNRTSVNDSKKSIVKSYKYMSMDTLSSSNQMRVK